jgi:hypothetical protein
MILKYLALIFSILSLPLLAQQQQFKMVAVGFYNLENLFDTVNDTLINDEDFLPSGANTWTDDKYVEKQTNMAYVISQIGTEYTKAGLSVFGVSEIENRKVLEDLVKEKSIADRNYQIVHFDSPDLRGIDVGLIYNPSNFKPLKSYSVPLIVMEDGRREFTRDILVVKGLLDGDTMTFVVNHWPSRRGGEEASAYKRNKGAAICRSIVDSLYKVNPYAKVMIMGDLNDDPTSISIKNYIKATYLEKEMRKGGIFNPMEDYYRRGLGSLAYRDSWSLFDQMMFTFGFFDKSTSGYKFHKSYVFNKQFLVQKSGQYKGYPFRTFSGNAYQGGFSDHFPVYTLLIKPI